LDRREVHETFIRFALGAPEYGVAVGRYVIMPDHIHLFAGFSPDSISLSKWLKSFKNAISKVLRKRAMFFGRKNPMTKNGSTFETIRSVRDWFDRLKNGLMPAKYRICTYKHEDDIVGAVYDRTLFVNKS